MATVTLTLREYGEHVLLLIKGMNYLATTTFTDKDTVLTSDTLRPYMPVVAYSNSGNIKLRISDSSNKIQVRSETNTSVTENIYAQIQWIKRSE